MKALIVSVVCVLAIFVSAVFGLFVYEWYYSQKYRNTQVSISSEKLKTDWGNPDKMMNYRNGDKTIFYYTPLNEYVFNVDEKGMVTFKYRD